MEKTKTSKGGHHAKKTKKEIKTAVQPEKKDNEELEVEPETELVEEKDGKTKKTKHYFEAVGRRKESIARVRLFTIKPFEGDEGKVTVNGKFYKDYFPTVELQQTVEAPLRKLKSLNRFETAAKVRGGGISGQAEALRHGLARALTLFNQDFRKKLKKAGYLKRDPRVKERRKYGLKKARRAPQWSKR